MKRRELIKSAALVGGITGLPLAHATKNATVFEHGVASGDPLQDRFIIWTRVHPSQALQTVSWQLAEDREFHNIVQQGELVAQAENDFTLKLDVQKLLPAKEYFYRFACNREFSPIGRCKTLAAENCKQARLAVVSCSNFPAGYFNVYRAIANKPDYDAVVHLGDYLYEYGRGGYGTQHAEALYREPVPANELKSLKDYRLRHAQYKSDTDLQAMHATHPMIAVWDDHEFANNAWQDGSPKSKSPDAWRKQQAAARQAYYEWMPIRENANDGINRHFTFGNLLSLSMLDTRLKGRERQPSRKAFAQGLERDREMLGQDQSNWLEGQLSKNSCRWTAIGQQVMVSPFHMPDLRKVADPNGDSEFARSRSRKHYQAVIESSKYGQPMLLDAWDGYPEARDRFLEILGKHSENAVILTGDIHTGICSQISIPSRPQQKITELITSSVTSPGLDDYLPSFQGSSVSDAFIEKNPHLSYVNGKDKGWIDVHFQVDKMSACWMTVDNIHSYSFTVNEKYKKTVIAKG
ncbi:alkaline phosphatase D family protein [uncultured Pseudoteredinibacter sp.]|uniref:alkaline phosphatase D family protein n=1 Tax=uncultured Pseudoteredinibacter sp. TaxID=1641701 RepID=UPI00262D511D|nr:alkaline phosphatase D family protein [uncultured Pseudoteredinibacter sp.]